MFIQYYYFHFDVCWQNVPAHLNNKVSLCYLLAGPDMVQYLRAVPVRWLISLMVYLVSITRQTWFPFFSKLGHHKS